MCNAVYRGDPGAEGHTAILNAHGKYVCTHALKIAFGAATRGPQNLFLWVGDRRDRLKRRRRAIGMRECVKICARRCKRIVRELM